MTVELHAAAHDAVGKEAGDKERDIAGELEFCETLAAVALKSLAIKFGERRSRTGFTLVERDEVIEELHEIVGGELARSKILAGHHFLHNLFKIFHGSF